MHTSSFLSTTTQQGCLKHSKGNNVFSKVVGMNLKSYIYILINFFPSLTRINLFLSHHAISLFTCSFWNFDALFQPQQHPARDSHDTFFLEGMFWLIDCLGHAFSTLPFKPIWHIHLQLHPLQGNYLKTMLSWWSVFTSLVVMAPGGMAFFFFWLSFLHISQPWI